MIGEIVVLSITLFVLVAGTIITVRFGEVNDN